MLTAQSTRCDEREALMLIKDAMIVWTPNRDIWKDSPTSGQIAVTTIPEAPALNAHPMSTGACDHNWSETDDAGRHELLQRYFTQMIHRDRLDEAVVRRALSVIDDVNPNRLSAERPDPNGTSWQ
jgi:hypothetical protein